LNSLKELDPIIMKFRIQVDLKNFSKAIKEISQDISNSHQEEIIQIIKKN